MAGRDVMARNLIVIVADTLRHPRFLEGTGPLSFLNRWAADGVALPRVISSSSWTCPSHVSLLAGVDPWQTHFYLAQSRTALPPSRSLADRWREAGGESVAFSENFLVAPQLGTAPGYDAYNPGLWARMAGNAQRAVTLFGYEQLLHRAMDRPDSASAARSGRGLRGVGTAIYRLINSMRSGVELNRALARGLRGRRSSRPLHLFVNFSEPHEPYLLPTADLDARALGHLPSINLARHTDYLARTGSGESFRRAYQGSLSELDRQLEVLFTTLQRHDLLRDALVLFVSDHGQALGENGFFGHGHYLHDELIEIPGILWSYRNGRAEPLPPPETDWVDLRHLHDLLIGEIQGETGSIEDRLRRSLETRGGAASYWEGPLPRAPAGFLLMTERSEIYRDVRVVRRSGTVTVRDPGDGGPTTEIPTPGHPQGPAELVEEARRLVALGRGEGSATTEVGTLGRDVDERLRSWGYD